MTHGVSEQMINTRRKRVGSMDAGAVKRLREIKQKNARLKLLAKRAQGWR